jgi:hypothetical protein
MVQSFFLAFDPILPGGKSNVGPRNSVTLSHSFGYMSCLMTAMYGSRFFNSSLMGPRRSQGESLCA